MKKSIIFFIFFLSSFLFFPGVFADEEEDLCFSLLNQSVKNDVRFKDSKILKNGDLSRVLLNEANNTLYDFSTYNNFYAKRAYKGTVEPDTSDSQDYFFQARRNNIGTIITENNYILSQVSGFGKDSNFDFPLSANNGIRSYGDTYKLNGEFFKEYTLYTHHLNRNPYDLLSCGIVKIIPLSGRSFSEVNEAGYMTNVLEGINNQTVLGNKKCSSGFEGSPKEINGKQYYEMKSDVCVIDYAQKDYVKIEVISLAYNNNSTRLNEYVTHKFQVEAMKNHRNHAEGLRGIQDTFRDDIYNNTCFSLIHPFKETLPEGCEGKYGGTFSFSQKGLFTSLFRNFFPQAEARLNVVGDIPESSEPDAGMVVQGNLPYHLYKKLQTIPDEGFREYLLLSIIPNFEEIIQSRKNQNIMISPYEETFLSCDIEYAERLEIVKDFLTKYNPETFSLLNLSYSNKKFGDCIIPYPDVSHLTQVIDGSFDSNKMMAEKLSGIYLEGEINPEITLYFQQVDEILEQYNKRVSDIERDFNDGILSLDEFQKLKSDTEKILNTAMNELHNPTLSSSGAGLDTTSSDVIEKTFPQKLKIILLISFLCISGIITIIISVFMYKKSKNNSK